MNNMKITSSSGFTTSRAIQMINTTKGFDVDQLHTQPKIKRMPTKAEKIRTINELV